MSMNHEFLKQGFPFLNMNDIQKYLGQKAVLVGQVISIRDGNLNLLVNNNIKALIVNCKVKIPADEYALIIVNVEKNKALTFIDMTPLGKDFDIKTISEFLNLYNTHPFFDYC